jgi:hypothetical protein
MISRLSFRSRLSFILVFIFLIVIVAIVIKSRISADVLTNTYSKDIGALWGKVSTTDGAPVKNAALSFGGDGVLIGDDGGYLIATKRSGVMFLSIQDLTSGQYYQFDNPLENELYFSTGDVLHKDIIVKPISSQVPPQTTPSLTSACSLDSFKTLPQTKENAIKYTYQLVLCRDYDTPGVGGWLGLVNSGKVTVGYLPIEFFKSGEFQAKIKPMSDTDFVTFLYRQLLRREPDAGGLNHWVNTVLGKGGTRESVFTGFVSSDEFRQIHTIYYLAR